MVKKLKSPIFSRMSLNASTLPSHLSHPVWSKNSPSIAVSKKLRLFNADEFIEGTGIPRAGV